jgi:hypothetical protein
MEQLRKKFDAVWLADFEYRQPDGETPSPHCMVAKEVFTGETLRLWADELQQLQQAPFPIDSKTLFVAYNTVAEFSCFLVLGWKLPARVFDPMVEFQWRTSGNKSYAGHGIVNACDYYGCSPINVVEKSEMRDVAIRGGPFTKQERTDLLTYCEHDVTGLENLLVKMVPSIDLKYALFRGRYMKAVANMEHTGIPIDVETFESFKLNWTEILGQLTRDIDKDFDVYVPENQKKANPESRFGQAIIEAAKRFEVDADAVASTLPAVHAEHKESVSRFYEAKRAARKATGLSSAKVNRLEGGLFDSSSYPGLDTTARELAGEYPSLGIGSGYVADESDSNDYGGRLFEILRDPDDKPKSKYDPDLINEAAQRVKDSTGDDFSGPLSFSERRFERYLQIHKIPWNRHYKSGGLVLDKSFFKNMAGSYPQLQPLAELRSTRSSMRELKLEVGHDGRNRTTLWPFNTKTGRNAPSTNKFVFGLASWLRSLIKPEPGMAISYCDWSAQEIAIAGYLSGDEKMIEAYQDDPYIWLAKSCGYAPPNATKQSHPTIRNMFKVVYLAANYRMGYRSLATLTNTTHGQAKEILRKMRLAFPRYWRWSDGTIEFARRHKYLQSSFGWRVWIGREFNERSVANFPLQSNGAAMMQIACMLATEAGIRVCCPVHDALLVESTIEDIDDVTKQTQEIMEEASRIVLVNGIVRTDSCTVRYPERYVDDRGGDLWNVVLNELNTAELTNSPF